MADLTDAQKLEKIEKYCRDLQAISQDPPVGEMSREERVHWEAINMGYHFAAENILNIIAHGTTRKPRTPKD